MPDHHQGSPIHPLAAAARRLRDAADLDQLVTAVLDGAAELFPAHGAVLAVYGDDGGYELARYRGMPLDAAQAVLAAPATALAADGPVALDAEAAAGATLAAVLPAGRRRAGLLLLVPRETGGATSGPGLQGAER